MSQATFDLGDLEALLLIVRGAAPEWICLTEKPPAWSGYYLVSVRVLKGHFEVHAASWNGEHFRSLHTGERINLGAQHVFWQEYPRSATSTTTAWERGRQDLQRLLEEKIRAADPDSMLLS